MCCNRWTWRWGAGTFHPATFLRALGPESWNAAYVQPSRRPTDGRHGENPNRLQHYYQFQVAMKPPRPTSRNCICSRWRRWGSIPWFTTSASWKTTGNPHPGAWGLGWEVAQRHGSHPVHFPAGGGLECYR